MRYKKYYKITILYCFFLLYSTHLFFPQGNHFIKGFGGYILDIYRNKSCDDGLILYKTEEDVNEAERWLTNHLGYINLNYRYKNILDLGIDFQVDFNKEYTDAESIYSLVQNLYLKVTPVSFFSMNFGKQQLKWGTSKKFHPIDKLEDRSELFSNRDVVEGVTGIKFVFLPTDWFSISLLFLPDLEIRWSKYAIRFDYSIYNADLDIGFGAIKYDFTHLAKIYNDGSYGTLPYDRVSPFIDFIKYFGNFGLFAGFEFRWGREMEFGYIDESICSDNNGNISSNLIKYELYTEDGFLNYPVFRISAGISYLMIRKPYMSFELEYFFNSEGFDYRESVEFNSKYKHHKEEFNTNDYSLVLPQKFGKFGSFRQHYIYLGFNSIQPIDFLSLSFSIYCIPATLGFKLYPSIEFNIKKLIYISLGYSVFFQGLDLINSDQYPSDINYIDYNHKITLIVRVGFSK